jgi:hypothetical protein
MGLFQSVVIPSYDMNVPLFDARQQQFIDNRFGGFHFRN